MLGTMSMSSISTYQCNTFKTVPSSLPYLSMLGTMSMCSILYNTFKTVPSSLPYLSMLGTMSMCSISTVVPLGGAFPERQSFGMGIGSVIRGEDRNSVRAPRNKAGLPGDLICIHASGLPFTYLAPEAEPWS